MEAQIKDDRGLTSSLIPSLLPLVVLSSIFLNLPRRHGQLLSLSSRFASCKQEVEFSLLDCSEDKVRLPTGTQRQYLAHGRCLASEVGYISVHPAEKEDMLKQHKEETEITCSKMWRVQ